MLFIILPFGLLLVILTILIIAPVWKKFGGLYKRHDRQMYLFIDRPLIGKQPSYITPMTGALDHIKLQTNGIH